MSMVSNVTRKIALLAAFTAPVIGTGGCTDKDSAQETPQIIAKADEAKPGIQRPTAPKPSQINTQEKNIILRDDIKYYKKIAPGITLFDEENKGYLTEDQAEKYVRVVIAKRLEGNLTLEEVDQLKKMITKLEDASKIYLTFREYDRGENIQTTIDNLNRVYNRYSDLDLRATLLEVEIKERKEKFYPIKTSR